VEIQLVEGTLGRVVVEGAERLRSSYVQARLAPDAGEVVNVFALERRLQVLQQGDLVDQVHAQLAPVTGRRESDLHVVVSEEPALIAGVGVANDRSPAVGENAGRVWIEHRNLTGFGDSLRLALDAGEGFVDGDARYSLPVSAADTMLELYAARQRSEVVESPFDEIDIESEWSTLGVGLRQPVWRDARQQFWLGLLGELRRGETSILGERFSFVPAADDGVTHVSVLRLLADWTQRGKDQALAVRSTFSAGFDVLGASEYGSHLPGSHVADGTFGAWLGQAHWVRRFPGVLGGSQLVARADAQLAHDPLLPLEQFAVGGSRTVRGYRESSQVRDNGLVGSLELRIPIWRGPLGEDRLQLAPFVDVGRAWNETKTTGPKTLSSAGIGLRWWATRRVFLSAYWGGRLRDIGDSSDGLQRAGFHVEASAALF
jgi:hemolysin activation/secretion protein